ncbi:MAG: hypothetical protein IJE49_12985 [Agathobacter sp.]|nr:hypothetical protein [Agathobacter sp.]
MKDIFYMELGKRAEEIRKMKQTATAEEIKERNLHLLEIIDEITYLSNVGRKEGLLALECAACDMDKSSQKYMRTLIMLIVDGTDPKLVEEICLMKYIANGARGYKGLEYLMQLVGGLAIQQGENPRVIEEKLLAMVPDEVEDIFRKRREEEIKSWYEQKTEDIDMSKVEQLYVGEVNTEIVNAGYPELEKLDCLLKQIQDRSLQRALREIDNADLELAMKGLSGEGRRRIFINMSKRLCVMVAEDMEEMARGRKSDIGEASQKIYGIFMRLMDCYEINPGESDEVYALYQEYKSCSDSEDREEGKKDGVLSLDEMIKLLSGSNS